MKNYNRKPLENQVKNTWLQLSFQNDVTDSFGSVIPYPHYHFKNNDRLVYCWLIDGFFETKMNVGYLNDIIARFKITFIDCRYLKHRVDTSSTIRPLKLSQFQGLKSKAKEIVKEKYQRAETHQDYVWWCIKLYCEDLIRQDGLIIYDSLESWAFKNFIDNCKDKSTLRAKCRGTYNWYFERDWKIGRVGTNKTKGEIMATRKEHAKKMTEKRANEAKKKVLNCITGMFADEYKKANGKWNISKIAKDTGTSRNTVMKYLPKDTLL